MVVSLGVLQACGDLGPITQLDGTSSGTTTTTQTSTSTGVGPTGLDSSSSGEPGSTGTTQAGSSSTGSPEPVCDNGIFEPPELCFGLDVVATLGHPQVRVAIGDLLGEGEYPDLLTVPTSAGDGAVIRVFRGGPEGLDSNLDTLDLNMIVQATQVRGIAVGDWAGDEKVEIVTPVGLIQLVVITDPTEDPISTTTPVNVMQTFQHVVAGDINGDEIPDVVAGTLAFDVFQVVLGGSAEGAGLLTPGPQYNAEASNYDAKLADLDEDGDGELVLSTQLNTPQIEVYAGMGAAFADAPQVLGVPDLLDVAIGNFDGQPGLELAASRFDDAADVGGLTVFSLSAGVTYDEIGQTPSLEPGNPLLLAAADFNGDGFDDLVSTQLDEGSYDLVLWTSTGDLSFEQAMVFDRVELDAGRFLRVADINLDMVPDVVLVTLDHRLVTLISNP